MVCADFLLCDVFAKGPLTGNQLAVFPEADGILEQDLQTIAREFNFSEVAFVLPARAVGDAFVRIFTPLREIPFAGHPILGTAAVLARSRYLERVQIEVSAGVVPVVVADGGSNWVSAEMTQPVPSVHAFPEEDRLLDALGVSTSVLPVELYDNGMKHIFVALESREAVARLHPDLVALTQLVEDTGIHAGVNCFAGDGANWKTRMFAPGDGVPEDPATGSAAGPLAVHLARHRVVDWGSQITITQGVELGRASVLLARATGTADSIHEVQVGGDVCIVGRGTLDALLS